MFSQHSCLEPCFSVTDVITRQRRGKHDTHWAIPGQLPKAHALPLWQFCHSQNGGVGWCISIPGLLNLAARALYKSSTKCSEVRQAAWLQDALNSDVDPKQGRPGRAWLPCLLEGSPGHLRGRTWAAIENWPYTLFYKAIASALFIIHTEHKVMILIDIPMYSGA